VLAFLLEVNEKFPRKVLPQVLLTAVFFEQSFKVKVRLFLWHIFYDPFFFLSQQALEFIDKIILSVV